MNLKRNAGKLLIAAGCVLIVCAAVLRIAGAQRQEQLLRDYMQSAAPSAEQQVSGEPSRVMPNGLLGVLSIPAISLETPLADGIESNQLRDGAGHFPGTARPGEAGNCAVAGHSSGVGQPCFAKLEAIHPGDRIEISTMEGTFVYQVREMFTVLPEEVQVIDPSGKAELTLVTCTPPLFPTHRFIVKADLLAEP